MRGKRCRLVHQTNCLMLSKEVRPLAPKILVSALWLISISLVANGQSFTMVSVATLPYQPVHDGFRGLSGIDYVDGSGWYVVSDRGWNAADHKKEENRGNLFFFGADRNAAASVFNRPTTPLPANASLESVRFDASTKTLFLSSENDDSSRVSYTSRFGDLLRLNTLLRVKNGSPNKGIEAVATTPSGHLWVAPEAGWAGETALSIDSIHVYCYEKPTKSTERTAFSYPIDRFPYAYFATDQPGGIADMVALNDSTLFVLERGYHVFRQRQGNDTLTTERVLGRLYEVHVEAATHRLQKKIAFDFNKPSQFNGILCNVEGICWGPSPTGKRRLYIIADDNFEDRPARKTTQQNQLIILEMTE